MTVTSPQPVELSTSDPVSIEARPRWARLMAMTGRVLIASGVVLGLFVGFQVWGTGIHEARAQATLRADFEDRFERGQARLADLVSSVEMSQPDAVPRVEDAPPEEPMETADPDVGVDAPDPLAGLDPDVLALLFPDDGEAVAQIEIPVLDVDKLVVRGTQVADLRNGPGLYHGTSLPGNVGNAAIAGHRTTYGAPFNRIDELAPGDEITITTVQGRFSYRVSRPEELFGDRTEEIIQFEGGHAIVGPQDGWVLGDFEDNRLTLTACNPKFSARQRIVVVAELVSAPVRLPDPIAQLVEAVEAGRIPGEVFVPLADTAVAPPIATDFGPPAAADVIRLPRIGAPADLDEGLGGERGAITPAIAWLTAAIGTWLVAGRSARRRLGWSRLVPYGLALLPAALALWMCFDAADRALPAY